jgi:hypothetical protein
VTAAGAARAAEAVGAHNILPQVADARSSL